MFINKLDGNGKLQSHAIDYRVLVVLQVKKPMTREYIPDTKCMLFTFFGGEWQGVNSQRFTF